MLDAGFGKVMLWRWLFLASAFGTEPTMVDGGLVVDAALSKVSILCRLLLLITVFGEEPMF